MARLATIVGGLLCAARLARASEVPYAPARRLRGTGANTPAPTEAPYPPAWTPAPTEALYPPAWTPAPTEAPYPPAWTPAPTEAPYPPAWTPAPTQAPYPPAWTPAPTQAPYPPAWTPAPTEAPYPPAWTPAPTQAPDTPDAACPEECKAPVCEAGFEPYDGWKDLDSWGRCNYFCSAPQAQGHRYCGDGADFTGYGSVDCRRCCDLSKGTQTQRLRGAGVDSTVPELEAALQAHSDWTEAPTQAPYPPAWTPAPTPCPPAWTPAPTEAPYPPAWTPAPTQAPYPPVWTPAPTEAPCPPAWTPAPTQAPDTPDVACPEECKAPVCEAGFEPYDGWKELDSWGRCNYFCSAPQAQGHRYCGDGADFTGYGSVDCRGCCDTSL